MASKYPGGISGYLKDGGAMTLAGIVFMLVAALQFYRDDIAQGAASIGLGAAFIAIGAALTARRAAGTDEQDEDG